jgi:hypothetical protein
MTKGFRGLQLGVSFVTKSRNIGRGGARPGSGPKKKPGAGPITEVPATTGKSAEVLAKELTDFAIAGLVKIASEGASESARVTALKEILNRGAGMPRPGAAAKTDQLELDDGWGTLLTPSQPATGRTN